MILYFSYLLKDISECEDKSLAPHHTNYSHNCHDDANFTNTKGSFYCTCHHGYSGDGVICTGKEIYMCVKCAFTQREEVITIFPCYINFFFSWLNSGICKYFETFQNSCSVRLWLNRLIRMRNNSMDFCAFLVTFWKQFFHLFLYKDRRGHTSRIIVFRVETRFFATQRQVTS